MTARRETHSLIAELTRTPTVLDSLPSLALDDFDLYPALVHYNLHGLDEWDQPGHLSSDAQSQSQSIRMAQYPYSDPVQGYQGVPLGKPRPLSHHQSQQSDFQLFGGGPSPSSSSYPSHDLPLPDLIPDSPTSFSPPNLHPLPPYPPPSSASLYHSSAFQQHRSSSREYERSSSVPIPSLPKPIRRRTQEFKDQQSLVPTLYHSQQAPSGIINHQNPFAPSSVSGTSASSSNGRAPSTDHPLSIPEQQDLLDRVRRDLHGVDLDNIKGPLRALALSSTSPRSTYEPLPPGMQQQQQSYQQAYARQQQQHQHQQQQQQQQQRERDEMMRKTVSPQEAFLDYEDVDHRLHPTGSPVNLFGVGPSLFAPLPRPAVVRTPPPPATTNSTSAAPIPTTSSSRSSSPSAAAVLSTSPRGSITSTTRKPHPFAVPQNAVSWADRRQRSGDDGDRDESDEDDDASEGGRTPAAAGQESSSDDDEEVVIGQFDEDTKPAPTAQVSHSRSFAPSSTIAAQPTYIPPVAPTLAPPPQPQPQQTWVGFAPPPAPSSSRSTTSSSHAEHMRPSARRALDMLYHVDDPVPGDEDEGGEDEDAEGEPDEDEATTAPRSRARSTVDDGGEYQPSFGSSVPAFTASGRPARSTAGNRKRSRTPFADNEDDSDPEDDGTFHEESDSDVGQPSSARPSTSSSTSHAPKQHRSHAHSAPNKRRRRIPAASSTISSSSTAIRCPHINEDSTVCGVVFRRPYDLARHRETIHGETPEGKVARRTEWVCKGCGGTFSRKDALIRHARIRGHKSGV